MFPDAMKRALMRVTIVLLGLPVLFLAVHTPFYVVALLLARFAPSALSNATFAGAFGFTSVAVSLGGALYGCWLMWRSTMTARR